MSDTLHRHAENLQNQLGLKLVARLDPSTQDLPYFVTERLRAARMQSLARRKVSAKQEVVASGVSGGAASLIFGDEGLSWWSRFVSAIPLVVLAIGLVSIDALQTQYRADEVAEVDSALLADELPPSAYADPGFAHFLKSDLELTR